MPSLSKITFTSVGLLLVLCVDVDASGQGNRDNYSWLRQSTSPAANFRRDNWAMKRLVTPIARETRQSVVQVISGDTPVALGTVVGEDGYVVTKRSELTSDPIRVRLSDGRLLPGRIAAVRHAADLALLKIESDETFLPIEWVDRTPPVGSFLVSPGRTGRSIGLGVVGSKRFRVDHQGRLGVILSSNGRQGAGVGGVHAGSGADVAGIEAGDQIVAINGQRQSDPREVKRTLGQAYPGDIVQLTIVRDGDTLQLRARLRDLRVLEESENDARVNGPRNERLSGFNDVIQHDTVLRPNDCGGPVLDTQGRAIGLNIARAGRVVSYALPASVVMTDIASMLNDSRQSR